MTTDALVFRRRFADDPTVVPGLADLLRDVFEIDVAPLDRLGRDPSVVSYGWWAGETLVANLSLARQTLWLMGAPVEARALQSVAVRPAWRGRGLFRDLTRRALAEADAEVPLVTLATETPALYAPFGFRPLAEVAFLGPLVRAAGRPANRRRLSLDDDADVALVRALFARRAPVSAIASLCEHPALFFLKAIESPEIALWHLPDLDAVVAIDADDPTEPALLDVVAPVIPPLAAIAAALDLAAERIRVLITPDRLDWRPTATEPEEAGDMVRGPFAAEGHPFVLSSMRV